MKFCLTKTKTLTQALPRQRLEIGFLTVGGCSVTSPLEQ